MERKEPEVIFPFSNQGGDSAYKIKTGEEFMQPETVYRLLKETYWAKTRAKKSVERSLKHSVCVGAFEYPSGIQIGFVRELTDYSTVYYVVDLIVEQNFRNKGVGRQLMKTLIGQTELAGLRGILITRNPAAEKLYESLDFTVSDTTFMEKPAVK